MDNTVNEAWIDKLVDELVETKNEVANQVVEVNQLYTLIKIIFNNTSLNYGGEGLRIDNCLSILEYLRVIDPDAYYRKLNKLKAEREAELKRLTASTAEEIKEVKVETSTEPETETETISEDPVEAARIAYKELIDYCSENDHDIKEVAKVYSLNSKSTAEEFKTAYKRLVLTDSQKRVKESTEEV